MLLEIVNEKTISEIESLIETEIILENSIKYKSFDSAIFFLRLEDLEEKHDIFYNVPNIFKVITRTNVRYFEDQKGGSCLKEILKGIHFTSVVVITNSCFLSVVDTREIVDETSPNAYIQTINEYNSIMRDPKLDRYVKYLREERDAFLNAYSKKQ